MAFTAAAFKTATRIVFTAGLLGAATMATPATAASLSLQIGSGPGFAQAPQLSAHNSWDGNYRMRCLTDREVVQGISAYGYGRVQIVADYGGDRLELRAVKGSWLYGMRIDKCTGQVDRLQRIGRASEGHDGYQGYGHHRRHGDGAGFSFGFQFGH